MADFSALKTAIQANIRTNGNEEITGAILQDILLSMVTTMGDGAINAIAEALAAEVAARQNAVGGEATTRAEADSQLSGRINAEAQARGEAAEISVSTFLQSDIEHLTLWGPWSRRGRGDACIYISLIKSRCDGRDAVAELCVCLTACLRL